MKKTIAFVGRSFISGEGVINLPFNSQRSMLDGDIIVISIDISSYFSGSTTFQGKPCLSDDNSFKLQRDTNHWRKEINAALESGRTVFVFLYDAPVVSVATGDHQYSGTGRNTRTTRIVTDFEPYSILPGKVGNLVRKSGQRIRPRGDLGPVAAFWKHYSESLSYEMYIDNFVGTTMLETQVGEKAVGGLVKYKGLKGRMLLLPVLDLNRVALSRAESLSLAAASEPSSGDDPLAGARRAKQLKASAGSSAVAQYFTSLIELDTALRNLTAQTPPPEWSQIDQHALPAESEIRSAIQANLSKSRELDDERLNLTEKLREAQKLRWLLFEKGRPLEEAILIALRVLGYEAEGVKDGDSEFDAVFIEPDGFRLLGEAEGRDDKAVNVDKLDQLERNLREDFSRRPEEHADYAHGVLFGNAYRLTDPKSRGEYFTPKCLIAAARSKISLVRTPDLFSAAKFQLENNDAEFQVACREAIRAHVGKIVQFPEWQSRMSPAVTSEAPKA